MSWWELWRVSWLCAWLVVPLLRFDGDGGSGRRYRGLVWKKAQHMVCFSQFEVTRAQVSREAVAVRPLRGILRTHAAGVATKGCSSRDRPYVGFSDEYTVCGSSYTPTSLTCLVQQETNTSPAVSVFSVCRLEFMRSCGGDDGRRGCISICEKVKIIRQCSVLLSAVLVALGHFYHRGRGGVWVGILSSKLSMFATCGHAVDILFPVWRKWRYEFAEPSSQK